MESGRDDGDGGGNQSQSWSIKSCKGYLMYNESRRAEGLSPRCIGLSRTLSSDTGKILRHRTSEIRPKDFKNGWHLVDFYYGCVGYAVYRDGKDTTNDDKERIELPRCLVGYPKSYSLITSLVVDTAPVVPRDKEEAGKEKPKRSPEPNKPGEPVKLTHRTGEDDFYSRFTRNANLVALRMVENMVKVKLCLKQGINKFWAGDPTEKEMLKHSAEPVKPIHPTRGKDFYSRFTRSTGLVASRMLENMVKVKTHAKQSIDEILGRRPK